MKKLFIAALIVMAPMKDLMACSLPPALYQQNFQMKEILNSKEYKEEIEKHMSLNFHVYITSIDFENGVNFNLSNNCLINVRHKYGKPTHPGLCPKFLGLDVQSICD